ncbi:exonuclease SbcCD subunit D [Bacillaceae bacterium]
MGGFRFIHAADLHLDSPFQGLADVPEEIRRRVRESTFRAFDRLIQLCLKERVDFLLIAGDVYDAADRSLKAQLRFQQGMQTLAEHGIHAYIVHGNHDPLDGYRAQLSWPDEVHFFSAGEVQAVSHLRGGKEIARIHGISFPTAKVEENYARRFRRAGDAPYAIGLLHANVEGDPLHDDYAPCRKEDLFAAGMDYWALGHIHRRRILHRYPDIVYPGNLQGRHIREAGAKGVYLVDVSDTGGSELTFRPLDVLRWQELEVFIDGFANEQELLTHLGERLEQVRRDSQGRGSIVRLRLAGRGRLHRFLGRPERTQDLLESLMEGEKEREDFVWIASMQVRTGRPVDRENLLQAENVLGDLLRYAAGAYEDPETLQRIKREALAPLFYDHRRASPFLDEMTEEEFRELLRQAEEMAIDLLLGEEAEEQ